MAVFQASQQFGRHFRGLGDGQHQTGRQAVLIDDGVDLGAQSSTRAADGVIPSPPPPVFLLAACWWARMMELSTNAMEPGD